MDNIVMRFAKAVGWSPKDGKQGNVASAIGFLENKYRVNYDQSHTGQVGRRFQLTPKNHHLKSLAHSPDIIGLFFSILNQFTNTSSFVSNGKLITIQNSDTQFELQGHNFISRLYCGFCNWVGHIMSDITLYLAALKSDNEGNGRPGRPDVLSGLKNFFKKIDIF